jgi:hypothetical protein
MKYIALLVAVLPMFVNAQTLGVKLGAEVELQPSMYYGQVGTTYSGVSGIYFDQPVFGRLGISIGVDYGYATINIPVRTERTMCCFGPCRSEYTTTAMKVEDQELHIPFSVTYRFLGDRDAKWQAKFFAGVKLTTNATTVQTTFIAYDATTNYTEVYQYRTGLLAAGRMNWINMPVIGGLEASHNWRRMVSTAGLSVSRSPFETYMPRRFPIDFASIYFKTGFNLRKKR